MTSSLDGKRLKQVIDPTVAKAFSHPLRGHVWVAVCERGVVSPTEVAADLGLEVSEVSYHFRELQRRNLIKLVRTMQRRGFNEHFYEPCIPVLYFDDFDWMSLPEAMRSTLSAGLMRQIIEEMIEALNSGSFESRARHLSQTWLFVDEQGWDEVMRTIDAALARLQAIQRCCVDRLGETSEPGIPVAALMASFETAAGVSSGDATRPL